MPRRDLIQLRRGTAAEWTSANPILAAGEEGHETDTGKRKVGNGTQNWNSLSYVFGGSGASVTSVNGQTGIVTLTKSDIDLANVDNTSDLNKPISTATQTALNAKQNTLGFTPENAANKSTNTSLGTSNTLYPSQNAVKSYVDTGLAIKQNLLPNFTNQKILFGDGTNIPVTSQYFNFNNATNQFTVGGSGVAGSIVVENNQGATITSQEINSDFTGNYNSNFFNSIASNISVALTPSDFSGVAEEIYISAIGDNTSINFSPVDTGLGNTYFINTEVRAGNLVVTCGGEYTSAISLDEAYINAEGFSYSITNSAKFKIGTTGGTMFKATRGFDIILNSSGDENGDPNTKINDVLNGFRVFAQGNAKANGVTQFVGFDFSAGFSGTSKTDDSFYGVRILNGSITMPNATEYYSWYSQDGEMFVQSNLATRKNMTLRTAASQTARVLDIQSNTGVSQLGIAGNGRDFILDTTTGTKWGTSTSQKQGWWNATPVVQPSAVADATGGAIIDTQARTAINALLAKLRTLGLIAT